MYAKMQNRLQYQSGFINPAFLLTQQHQHFRTNLEEESILPTMVNCRGSLEKNRVTFRSFLVSLDSKEDFDLHFPFVR